MKWARKLSTEIEEMINVNVTNEADKVKVFPYSIFYVFYEQYLTIWEDTLTQLGISLLAVFVVTYFMLGELKLNFGRPEFWPTYLEYVLR